MSQNQKAIILSILGFFLLSVGDITRKYAMLSHTAEQVQLWTSAFSLIFIILIASKLGGIKSLRTITKPHIHILRAVLLVSLAASVIYALGRISLDVFYVVIFTAPFITGLMATWFFNEKLTLTKIILMSIGFLGVIFIARPGSDIDMIGVGLTLYTAIGFSLVSVLAKKFKANEAKFPFAFLPTVLAVCVFFMLNNAQIPLMDHQSLLLCFIAGSTNMLSLVIHVHAFQIAHASVAAPYHYTQLIWGLIFGLLLFGDIPDIWVTMGAVTIIGSGLALYFYDTRTARKTELAVSQPASK